jgi:predicted TIM-barrel fold metal-dependent hydrolase
VLCSIATKPAQFEPILRWSMAIRSPRIVPLPSVHPADPDMLARLDAIHAAGFKGIKLHPYYQDFLLDDERLMPLYARLAERGLLLVCHTGFDVAFPRIRRCDPRRIRAVCDRVPTLKFVATHLGAWEDWDEVEKHLLGRDIFLEISYSLEVMPPDRARRLILAHPEDRVLFGTDSPWQDQSAALDRLRALDVGDSRFRAMTEDNASLLLDSCARGV